MGSLHRWVHFRTSAIFIYLCIYISGLERAGPSHGGHAGWMVAGSCRCSPSHCMHLSWSAFLGGPLIRLACPHAGNGGRPRRNAHGRAGDRRPCVVHSQGRDAILRSYILLGPPRQCHAESICGPGCLCTRSQPSHHPDEPPVLVPESWCSFLNCISHLFCNVWMCK